MEIKVEPLTRSHLRKLLNGPMASALKKAYLSKGSVAYCLVADGVPVFAGGVVNMHWRRGEAWMLPTPFFRNNIKTCYRYSKEILPLLSVEGNFKRIQATCSIMVSTLLFEHLGFESEGVLQHFGPNGETCHMYAKVFR